jgi:hypothetical protein
MRVTRSRHGSSSLSRPPDGYAACIHATYASHGASGAGPPAAAATAASCAARAAARPRASPAPAGTAPRPLLLGREFSLAPSSSA